MLICKVLTTLNDLVEVDFQVVCHQIYDSEIDVLGRIIIYQIEKVEDVLVVHITEDPDLSQNTFGIHNILDFMKLLYGTFV